jgi:hypothetical protein
MADIEIKSIITEFNVKRGFTDTVYGGGKDIHILRHADNNTPATYFYSSDLRPLVKITRPDFKNNSAPGTYAGGTVTSLFATTPVPPTHNLDPGHGLKFIPVWAGATDVGPSNEIAGVTVMMDSGKIRAATTMPAGFTDPKFKYFNFRLEARVKILGGATISTYFRVFIHDAGSLDRVWITPDTLHVQKLTSNYRFNIFGKFNDGWVADLSEVPGITWSEAPASSNGSVVATTGRITVDPGAIHGSTFTVKATFPAAYSSKTATGTVKVDADVSKYKDTLGADKTAVAEIIWGDKTKIENINILLLADGFSNTDEDTFKDYTDEIATEFLKHEPFTTCKDSINIWKCFLPAEKSGITTNEEIVTTEVETYTKQPASYTISPTDATNFATRGIPPPVIIPDTFYTIVPTYTWPSSGAPTLTSFDFVVDRHTKMRSFHIRDYFSRVKGRAYIKLPGDLFAQTLPGISGVSYSDTFVTLSSGSIIGLQIHPRFRFAGTHTSPFTVEELVKRVGYPTESDSSLSDSDLADKWEKLFANTLGEFSTNVYTAVSPPNAAKIRSDIMAGWKLISNRRLFNHINSKFGMYSGLPKSDDPKVEPYLRPDVMAGLNPFRMPLSTFQLFLDGLKESATGPLLNHWNSSSKNRPFVLVLLPAVKHTAVNSRRRYARFSIANEIMVEGIEFYGPVQVSNYIEGYLTRDASPYELDFNGPGYFAASLDLKNIDNLIYTIVHEMGHSFPLDDEYWTESNTADPSSYIMKEEDDSVANLISYDSLELTKNYKIVNEVMIGKTLPADATNASALWIPKWATNGFITGVTPPAIKPVPYFLTDIALEIKSNSVPFGTKRKVEIKATDIYTEITPVVLSTLLKKDDMWVIYNRDNFTKTIIVDSVVSEGTPLKDYLIYTGENLTKKSTVAPVKDNDLIMRLVFDTGKVCMGTVEVLTTDLKRLKAPGGHFNYQIEVGDEIRVSYSVGGTPKTSTQIVHLIHSATELETIDPFPEALTGGTVSTSRKARNLTTNNRLMNRVLKKRLVEDQRPFTDFITGYGSTIQIPQAGKIQINSVEWYSLISGTTPLGDYVGLYPGGDEYKKLLYHPTGNCRMRSSQGANRYCPICTMTIVSLINPRYIPMVYSQLKKGDPGL